VPVAHHLDPQAPLLGAQAQLLDPKPALLDEELFVLVGAARLENAGERLEIVSRWLASPGF
jgi:hypothetical protein